MSGKLDIGAVLIHKTGTNPYRRDEQEDNPYRIGDGRKTALAQWRETGQLPEGYSAWNDREKKEIKSPDEVQWYD